MLLLSDLHFGPLLPEDTENHLLAAALADPDRLVVISGDLTQRALKDEYDRASAFFTLLMQQGISICATPGNHDFGGVAAEVFHKVTDDYTKARANLSSLFLPMYNQNNIIAYNDLYHDCVLQHGNSLFFCIKSQHRSGPRVKKVQLAWAERILSERDVSNMTLFMVCHHSLWKDGADHHPPMARRKRFEDRILVRFNFYAFVHGHNHRFTYQNTTTPKLGYRIRRLAVPTACTRSRDWERGFVHWLLPAEPTLVVLPDL